MSQQPTIMGPKKYKVPLGKGGLISDWIFSFFAIYEKQKWDETLTCNDNTILVGQTNNVTSGCTLRICELRI